MKQVSAMSSQVVDHYRFGNGNVHYKVVVQVSLNRGISPPENKNKDSSNGFYMTLGVTAPSLQEAAGLAESRALVSQDEHNDCPGPIGEVVEMSLELFRKDEIPSDIAPISTVMETGVHFATGRIYFVEDEEEGR